MADDRKKFSEFNERRRILPIFTYEAIYSPPHAPSGIQILNDGDRQFALVKVSLPHPEVYITDANRNPLRDIIAEEVAKNLAEGCNPVALPSEEFLNTMHKVLAAAMRPFNDGGPNNFQRGASMCGVYLNDKKVIVWNCGRGGVNIYVDGQNQPKNLVYGISGKYMMAPVQAMPPIGWRITDYPRRLIGLPRRFPGIYLPPLQIFQYPLCKSDKDLWVVLHTNNISGMELDGSILQIIPNDPQRSAGALAIDIRTSY